MALLPAPRLRSHKRKGLLISLLWGLSQACSQRLSVPAGS
jgi:hypothetical protein